MSKAVLNKFSLYELCPFVLLYSDFHATHMQRESSAQEWVMASIQLLDWCSHGINRQVKASSFHVPCRYVARASSWSISAFCSALHVSIINTIPLPPSHLTTTPSKPNHRNNLRSQPSRIPRKRTRQPHIRQSKPKTHNPLQPQPSPSMLLTSIPETIDIILQSLAIRVNRGIHALHALDE